MSLFVGPKVCTESTIFVPFGRWVVKYHLIPTDKPCKKKRFAGIVLLPRVDIKLRIYLAEEIIRS